MSYVTPHDIVVTMRRYTWLCRDSTSWHRRDRDTGGLSIYHLVTCTNNPMVSPAPPHVITIHNKELWMAEGLGGVREGWHRSHFYWSPRAPVAETGIMFQYDSKHLVWMGYLSSQHSCNGTDFFYMHLITAKTRIIIKEGITWSCRIRGIVFRVNPNSALYLFKEMQKSFLLLCISL